MSAYPNDTQPYNLKAVSASEKPAVPVWAQAPPPVSHLQPVQSTMSDRESYNPHPPPAHSIPFSFHSPFAPGVFGGGWDAVSGLQQATMEQGEGDLTGVRGVGSCLVPGPDTVRQIALLQSRLTRGLGPEFIDQRQGPGGSKLNYVAGWKAINIANEVFGFNGWSTSIIRLDTDFIDESAQHKFDCSVSAIVRVTLRDGTYHEDVGCGEVKNLPSKAAAIQKCKKEAVTDATKRTLRNFGNVLGNCLYDKDFIYNVSKIKVGKPKFDEKTLYRRPEYDQYNSRSDIITDPQPPPPPLPPPPPPEQSTTTASASSSSHNGNRNQSAPPNNIARSAMNNNANANSSRSNASNPNHSHSHANGSSDTSSRPQQSTTTTTSSFSSSNPALPRPPPNASRAAALLGRGHEPVTSTASTTTSAANILHEDDQFDEFDMGDMDFDAVMVPEDGEGDPSVLEPDGEDRNGSFAVGEGSSNTSHTTRSSGGDSITSLDSHPHPHAAPHPAAAAPPTRPFQKIGGFNFPSDHDPLQHRSLTSHPQTSSTSSHNSRSHLLSTSTSNNPNASTSNPLTSRHPLNPGAFKRAQSMNSLASSNGAATPPQAASFTTAKALAASTGSGGISGGRSSGERRSSAGPTTGGGGGSDGGAAQGRSLGEHGRRRERQPLGELALEDPGGGSGGDVDGFGEEVGARKKPRIEYGGHGV